MNKYKLLMALMIGSAPCSAVAPDMLYKNSLNYSTAKSAGRYSVDTGGVVTVGKPKPKDKPKKFSEKVKPKRTKPKPTKAPSPTRARGFRR